MSKPRVLICDIETLPLVAWTWGMFDQNIGLNQIAEDWTVLSWSAKWLGEKTVMYDDVRGQRNLRNDKRVLKGIWKLLNEADVVCWHYGKAFDHKKLNARFILNGFKPPSPYRQIDTKQMASKTFGFTSNKLEYLTDKLNTKYKKSKHKKFEGFAMWKECMAGNLEAFKEMEAYNKMDVLSLEELYLTLAPWGNPVNFDIYEKNTQIKCNCGSTSFKRKGFNYTKSGKFQQYQCRECGSWSRGQTNLVPKEHRKAMKKDL